MGFTGQSMVPTPLLQRIVETMHPEQIWLFGSRARGDARPDSDWDLLVVVPDETPDEDLEAHVVWRKVMSLGIPTDVIAVRCKDFTDYGSVIGSLSHEVRSNGVTVYHA